MPIRTVVSMSVVVCSRWYALQGYDFLAKKSYDSAPQFCLELYSVQSLNEDVKSKTRRQSNNFELLQFRGIKGSIGLRSHLQSVCFFCLFFDCGHSFDSFC